MIYTSKSIYIRQIKYGIICIPMSVYFFDFLEDTLDLFHLCIPSASIVKDSSQFFLSKLLLYLI